MNMASSSSSSASVSVSSTALSQGVGSDTGSQDTITNIVVVVDVEEIEEDHITCLGILPNLK